MQSTDTIQVGIVDDHPLVRRGLAALLEYFEQVEVVLEAGNGEELLERLKFDRPSIVLLDMDMPVMDGRTALPLLKAEYPEIKVIILTMHDEDGMIVQVMELGANGFLNKGGSPEELEKAIVAVHQTDYYLSDRVSRLMLQKVVSPKAFKLPQLSAEVLSKREMEVLQLVCKEFSNAGIAEQLHISHRTVEGHRQRIIQKIGVRNTIGMVVYAIREGLVEL